MSRRKNRRGGVLKALLALCLLGAAAMGFLLWHDLRPSREAEGWYEAVRRESFSAAGPDWQALRAQYPGIAGWLAAPEIGVDYPVMQGEDNQYYLNHLPDGSWNAAGSVFLDAACSPALTDPVTLVYGHHVGGGAMFSALLGYRKQSFYEKHPTLTYYTPEQAYRVEVFAALQAQEDDTPAFWGYAEAVSEASRRQWLEEIAARSDISGEIPGPDSRLMGLVTCFSTREDAPRYIIYGKIEAIE